MIQVRRRHAVLAGLFAGALCASCAMAAQEINAYSIMPEMYAAPVTAEFTRLTGIKVNFMRFSAGEALARLVAEKDNPQVDVLIGGPADTYEAGMEKGVFASYVSPSAETIPADLKDPKGFWTGIGIIPLCFLTNTDFLASHNLKAPASWADLLNPAYEKGLQMADARTSGTATERIYSLVKVMGEDEAFAYQKKLNDNVQMYTKSGAGGAMPVATGQAAAGIFYICDALQIQQQGYPVEITYPSDGVTYGIEAVGIVANCAHPDLAKKFVDWMTSVNYAQFIVENKINYVPTQPSVKTENPLLDLSKINLQKVPTEWKGANRDRLVERWVNEVIK
ncbi:MULTISPECIES: ABC transporter substrate-binding protein [Jonquetella]|uniref:ABC transporter substrate-binding protein n=1 Tax=Jonquetella TaxID=428711 RepID=UPI0001B914BD|nr:MULTISPECIES: ABC transporter substrate-binding protein [Jonquetella]EEX48869.1 ABC transporter, solute-binding protein [Jonquetella anthropi E3_33 E1]